MSTSKRQSSNNSFPTSKKRKMTSTTGSSGVISNMNIGFIGAGNMARALVEGILASGEVNKKNIYASCTSLLSLNYKKMEALGVNVTINNKHVITNSDTIILAVKPYQILDILDELQDTYKELTATNPLTGVSKPPKNLRPLIISVANGVLIKEIEQKTQISWNIGGSSMVGHLPVIRCIPSVASAVRAGVTVYTCGKYCNETDVKPFQEIFSLCGHCEEVPEKSISALASIGGSGVAFMALIVEAMTDGGVLVGIPKPLGEKIVAHTMISTAKLIIERNWQPSEIKYAVSSPAGTTIRGIQVMEDRGVRGAIIGAIQVTTERAEHLKPKSDSQTKRIE